MATADATIRIVAEDKTAAAFKKLDTRLDKTTRAFKKFAVGIAAVVGAAGIGRLVGGTINAADQIDKLSTRLGVGSRALSEYKHVADISGVSFETLTMGLQRMTRRVAEAANGMGEARGALKELGLDATKLNNLTLDQKFEVIADKLAGLGSESDRVRLAMKLFDSEGVALIQTMEGGAAGIAEMREEARKLGLSLSQDQVKAAAAAKDEWARFMGVLKGVINVIVINLLPPLTLVIETLRDRLVKAIDVCVFAWNKLKAAIAGLIDLIKTGWFRVQIALNNSILFMIDGLVKAVDVIIGFQNRVGQTFIHVDGLKDRLMQLQHGLNSSNAEMQEQIDALDQLTIHIDVFGDETKETNKVVVDAVRVMDDLGDATLEVADALTEGDKAAVKVATSIIRVNAETIKLEDSLTEAEQALKDWGDTVIDAQKENDLLIDKLELLDELFQDGKISGEVYERTLRALGHAFNDAADDGVALVEVVEETKTVFDELVDGIDSSWTQMWQDLFGGGKTEDVLKGFLNRVKKMFLDTLAEIVAAWTKKKIIEMITGVVGGGSVGGGSGGSLVTSILGSAGGSTAAGSVTSGGIGSAITSGVGKIISSIFGAGTTSSGVVGAGAAASSTAAAGTAAAGAGMSALGFALPLAILGFGLFRSNKIKKMMKKKYRELMADPSITANLADHALFEHIQVLGEQAGQTWVQIGDTAARVLDEVTTRSMGVMKLGYREMRDEFGNVLVTAGDFSKLMDTLERQKPFLKHADDLVKLHGEMGLAKESIDLINVELFEADAAFQKMGQAGIDAIMKINTKSTAYATMMQKGFVTAVQTAQMGIGEFGNISAEVFDTIVQGVQEAEGSMKSLAEAAQLAIIRGERAASLDPRGGGFQHGGSFIVGGGGGTDSQRVSFMATPGERVSVETPNQSKASGSDGGNVVRELRALRHDLATVVAKPIVGAVTRGQLAMAGGARH